MTVGPGTTASSEQPPQPAPEHNQNNQDDPQLRSQAGPQVAAATAPTSAPATPPAITESAPLAPPATPELAVQVENVYKVFGRRSNEAVRQLKRGATRDEIKNLGTAAVIDASFDVARGEIFVVMGLSGSGKSTLIRMLNGLLKPTDGHVRIGGADLADVTSKELRDIRQRSVSMVFQHFALLPHRTVRDNAAYPLEIQGMAKEERLAKAQTALELVGLAGWEDHLPSQLSGGMRQRVGLARALAADTDVLLMDEAFSALDPLIRREMQEQLVELQHTLGKTIIFITHDLNEAMFLGDRIAVMRDGRVVQIGTSEEILSDPANDYVAQFVADVDRTRVLTASSLMVRPGAAVLLTGGPRHALLTMRQAQVSAAYVIDRTRRLHGVVYDHEVVAAHRAGVTSLQSLVHDDVTAVTDTTSLSEIFAPAAESALPVPVTDAAGRLVGVIPRVALLEAMVPSVSEDTGTAEDIDDVAADTSHDGSDVPVPAGDAPARELAEQEARS